MSYPVVLNEEAIRWASGTMTTDFNGGVLHLFTAVTGGVINPASDSSQFTQPTYTGYAGPTVATWSAPFLAADGQIALSMGSVSFVGPADLSGQTILGCYYIGSGVLQSCWAAIFDSPFPLLTALTLLVITAQVTTGGSGWVSTEGSSLP